MSKPLTEEKQFICQWVNQKENLCKQHRTIHRNQQTILPYDLWFFSFQKVGIRIDSIVRSVVLTISFLVSHLLSINMIPREKAKKSKQEKQFLKLVRFVITPKHGSTDQTIWQTRYAARFTAF